MKDGLDVKWMYLLIGVILFVLLLVASYLGVSALR